MSKGPKFNNIKMNFTTRDSLGIDSVATSMQAELCPVVNTVTPRAFYWPFMVWNYYDFLTHSDSNKWSLAEFDKPFLKKNDYFFVLASLMTEGSDLNNLVGRDKTAQDYSNNPKGPFYYNENYFIARYGGMQYYNAGCLTLGFITEKDNSGNSFGFPRLTESIGKPMALAFESMIKNTRYFKVYRLQKNPAVPKDVLKEFGKSIKFNLDGFDECKYLLRKALFEPISNTNLNNKNLIESSEYLKMLYYEYDIKNPDAATMRKVLFDYFSPRGEYKYAYDASLESIIKSWEAVIGRSYFSIAIEIIWKFILTVLEIPMTRQQWLDKCLKKARWTIDIKKPLAMIIDECNFDYETREKMIAFGYRNSRTVEMNIENGIKILISISNRFRSRDDVNTSFLLAGEDVSIAELTNLIDEYRNKPISEFILYIINNWIITRHKMVALGKLAQGRNGFYFEEIDGVYIRKEISYPDYQGLRLLQLMQVMKDLDMLED